MNQRRQIMVDSKLQFHFFWLWISVSAGILAVIAIAGLSRYSDKLIKDESIRETLKMIFWITGGYILTLSVVFGSYTIFHLHRIAGPAYRMRKCVESFLQGDLTPPVKLRKKDYMQDLASCLEALREKMCEERKAVESARQKLSEGSTAEAIQDLDRVLNGGEGSIRS